MKRICIILFVLLMAPRFVESQENITYQVPPAEILELVDIERAPSVNMDSKGGQMLFLYRNTFKTLSDLNQPEVRLAGLRINPDANISSTVTYSNNIRYKKTKEKEVRQIEGLPSEPLIAYISFSPDETKLAFTNTVENGVELWIADLKTLQAGRVTDAVVNANAGFPYSWFNDGSGLLVRMLPENRPELIDTQKALPEGPIVSVSDGQISQNRTYQDLLKNPVDEANFETLMTSELYKVGFDGSKTRWKEAGMYISQSFSPDGKYLLLTTLSRPFSYTVPYYSFPNIAEIYTADGDFLMKFNEQPLLENLPIGFMATQQGKRNINWRADKSSTLYWAEALDKGDPEVKVDFRDEVFQLDAPFTGSPRSLVKTINRYAGITWGNDEYAILRDYWWNTRNQKMYVFNPSDNKQEPRIIVDRNYQNVYDDPGYPQTAKNALGTYTLQMDGNSIYFFADGFTADGQFPFIDELDLRTLQKKRIYQSAYTDKVEELVTFVDSKKGIIITRIESPTEYPNYYIRNIRNKRAPEPLTAFENPFKSIENVYKEVISYKREDGVELTGTLYLPAGYDREKKEKLPMVMWAYPTEYKDRNSAGQTTANPNSFTYLSYGNPIYWVTRGYAILDDAAFPIVGEGDDQPNDTFVEQLVANAKAAIDAVDALGYIDRERVAVGGHSYGAFMTANLLTHSDLFAAGIARSGAYNRTLTPFGFQAEERNYWVAPETYNAMSPFMHADKMKTPLLLTHGESDNNSGTHTMQSERYFQALKSFGAPVRLVLLPKESHGYAARENVLHLLWEQDQWLEKYVKMKDKK
ncbi:prolyl oligopeptidase [Proteiniphilum saccharofermentans]|uniref:Prolyl oligopeptidase n=1 Tax=Proteiniphilum saccharofermentans TaxID=1642647 RepID=A0A1R3SWM9_9BACT|nr:prolyl oligopeptidase family serine peptidase [Proteiniphilum saccharofermentans]SCD19941.1 prolyl oligopeptidase [Proteiniphilum saccharofermentans]